jgi:flagellar basal body-associated protein FliL
MSILEIILMVTIGIGMLVWATIIVVKFINRKKHKNNNLKEENAEVYEDEEA